MTSNCREIDCLAVLLTVYNRRESTLACLRTLFAQSEVEQLELAVYLVDDGSTDGTQEAVAGEFPMVRLLSGDGTLFWSGGMRRAFGAALEKGYPAYLWLNDDTILKADALRTILDAHQWVCKEHSGAGVIVGSTLCPDSGEHTYGGVVRTGRLRRLGFRLVTPSHQPIRCHTFNGNVVLVPDSIARRVGSISPEFTHGFSDRDYGLRAEKLGFKCWVAPGYVGHCGRNPPARWTDSSMPFGERWSLFTSPKGLPPREWATYARRHGGPLWPIDAVLPIIRVAIPGLWKWLKR
jgi:GT2 family glycosyltransferase